MKQALAVCQAEQENIAETLLTAPAFAACRDDEKCWDVTVGDGANAQSFTMALLNDSKVSPLSLSFSPAVVGALDTLTRSIGTDAWFEAALGVLESVCHVDSGGVMVFHRQSRPHRIVHRFNPSERSLPEDAFLAGPYVLDPTYQLFVHGCNSGIYWLHDIAPDDFYDSEFYRAFYSQIGLSDSIDLLWRINEDTALNIFVERSIRNKRFSQADMIAITMLAPLLFASAAKNHEFSAAAMTQVPSHPLCCWPCQWSSHSRWCQSSSRWSRMRC